MAQANREPVIEPDTIGRFKVLEALGTGGMAEVFLGVPLQRLPDDPPFVALKRLLPAIAASQPETYKMFLDEAAILSRLNHRNIVRLIDVCSGAGSTYLVMEHLDGVDLSEVIKRFAAEGKSLPHAFSARVVAEIADALSYATKAQTIDGKSMELVHRDISPQNIFIQTDGSVRLLDFGVARANDRITTTRTGMVKGKLSYMSPEQAACEVLDHRSDIFALGIVLYELTIGRRPFRGKNEFKLLQSIIECKVVWPTELYSSYPLKLQRVLERMLARDVGDRYRDAAEASRDLRDYLSDVSIASAFTPRAVMAKHFADKIELSRSRAERYANLVVTPRDDEDFALSLDEQPDLAPPSSDGEKNPIVKEITDTETTVVVNRYVAASAWRRALDGLDGLVVIRFETDESCRGHVEDLLAGFAVLTEDVASVRLQRAPIELVDGLVSTPGLDHIVVASRRTACPSCAAPVIVIGEAGRCERCRAAFTLLFPLASASACELTVPELRVSKWGGAVALVPSSRSEGGPGRPASAWSPQLPSLDAQSEPWAMSPPPPGFEPSPGPPAETRPPAQPASSMSSAPPVVVVAPTALPSPPLPPSGPAATTPVKALVFAAAGGAILALFTAAVLFVLLR